MISLPDISSPHPLLNVREWRQMLVWALYHLRGEMTTLEQPGDRHAWHCRLEFDPIYEFWRCQVQPGYVGRLKGSGHLDLPETVANISASLAPGDTRVRLEGKVDWSQGLDAYLTEEPWLPVRQFRAIGDGEGEAAALTVPPTFRALGVGPPVSKSGEYVSGPRRWLRAASVVLYQPRPFLRTSWTIGADDIVSILPSARLYAQIAGGGRDSLPPFISLAAGYVSQNPELLRETLARGGDDDPWDTRLVATLYFVSPLSENRPGPNDTPDGDWTVHVQHELFHNLSYAARIPDLRPVPSRPVFFTRLAGGVADVLIVGLQRVIDDSLANAQTAVDLVRVEGRFWSV